MFVSHSPAILAEIQVPVFAGSVGAAATLIIQQCGLRFRWCRSPQAHHTHKDPVPRLGGIAVFLAVALACVIAAIGASAHSFALALAILFASLPVLLVGTYDDLRHAGPKAKVLAQLVGAAILVAAHWKITGSLSLSETLFLPAWLVLATNSFNLIDGVDGLAAGTAVIIGVALSACNLVLGNVALSALAAFVAAASLGFLPFNLSRARIFLGDSGSLTLGFVLAAIAFETPHSEASQWSTVLLFGYPLLETGLSIFRRTLKSRSLFRPDREHLHHKLCHVGFSARACSVTLWVVALAFAALGVMLIFGASFAICFCAALVLVLATARSFGYLRPRWMRLVRRRLAIGRSEDQQLPDIAGYLPFK
jgi:UDP-GlcNAc:undecaprenyl-phosphate GlcNAc-1-phosphate transferase